MNNPPAPRNILQGYVQNIQFGELRVPAPMQNLMIRDYATRNNLIFKLSVGEYSFPGCFLQLEGLFPQLHKLEGVGMCSMFMLPKSAERREKVYDAFIKAGAALHLILEGIVIREQKQIDRVEETLKFNQWIKKSPTKIPADLLPKLSIPDWFN